MVVLFNLAFAENRTGTCIAAFTVGLFTFFFFLPSDRLLSVFCN